MNDSATKININVKRMKPLNPCLADFKEETNVIELDLNMLDYESATYMYQLMTLVDCELIEIKMYKVDNAIKLDLYVDKNGERILIFSIDRFASDLMKHCLQDVYLALIFKLKRGSILLIAKNNKVFKRMVKDSFNDFFNPLIGNN